MTVLLSKEKPSPSSAFVEAVEEITRLYRSLPPRPSIEQVEAAMSVLQTVDTEEQTKLDEITKQEKPRDVSEDLFSVLQQFKKTMVLFQSCEQRKEASHLVEVDKLYGIFDELVRRASGLVSGDNQMEKVAAFADSGGKIEKESVITDETLVKTREDGEIKKDGLKDLVKSASTKGSFFKGKLTMHLFFMFIWRFFMFSHPILHICSSLDLEMLKYMKINEGFNSRFRRSMLLFLVLI